MADSTNSAVVVDLNKSAEQYIKEIENDYIVPDLIRQKFPDLVKLIFETESMNQEEREYWLQIMPIMGEDQIVKFREILVNEKQELAKLDQEKKIQDEKYGEAAKTFSQDEMKERMDQMKAKEKESESAEKQAEEDLLNNLNQL